MKKTPCVETAAATKKDADAPRYRGSELIRTATGTARDILTVLLAPDALYTPDEVAEMIQKFMQGGLTNGGRHMDHTK